MSKKQKANTTKTKKSSKIGEIVKSLPAWLKFAGLLVPIAGIVISFFSYSLEKQKNSENITILASTESTINFEQGKAQAYPPVALSIFSKNDLVCGRDLIISNNGGVNTSLIGFQGKFSHESFSQPITFETTGSEVFLAGNSANLPKGLSSVFVTILNDHLWLLSPEAFRETDILAFPVDVQAHSSFNVRVAIRLRYENEDEAGKAFKQFDYGEDVQNRDKVPRLFLQFITSTSMKTEPIEIKCIDGIIFFPTDSTPTPSAP